MEHRRIVLAERQDRGRVKLDLALFSTKSATLRVIDNPSGHDDLAAVAQRENASGWREWWIFRSGESAGRIVDQRGKINRALAQGSLAERGDDRFGRPNPAASHRGIFAETKRDRGAAMRPVSGRSWPTGRRTQCHSDASSHFHRHRRIRSSRDWVLFGCDAGERSATILATPAMAPDLKIQRALNLDGGSSSAFWFAGERGSVSISEQKTVRNFVRGSPEVAGHPRFRRSTQILWDQVLAFLNLWKSA